MHRIDLLRPERISADRRDADANVLRPIVSALLLEQKKEEGEDEPSGLGALFPAGAATTIVEKRKAALDKMRLECAMLLPKHNAAAAAAAANAPIVQAVSPAEIDAAVLCLAMRVDCTDVVGAVVFTETMLRDQLEGAVGKQLKSSDFAELMTFHERNLYRGGVAPSPFCYAGT